MVNYNRPEGVPELISWIMQWSSYLSERGWEIKLSGPKDMSPEKYPIELLHRDADTVQHSMSQYESSQVMR
jgi:hypothetical protein